MAGGDLSVGTCLWSRETLSAEAVSGAMLISSSSDGMLQGRRYDDNVKTFFWSVKNDRFLTKSATRNLSFRHCMSFC